MLVLILYFMVACVAKEDFHQHYQKWELETQNKSLLEDAQVYSMQIKGYQNVDDIIFVLMEYGNAYFAFTQIMVIDQDQKYYFSFEFRAKENILEVIKKDGSYLINFLSAPGAPAKLVECVFKDAKINCFLNVIQGYDTYHFTSLKVFEDGTKFLNIRKMSLINLIILKQGQVSQLRISGEVFDFLDLCNSTALLYYIYFSSNGMNSARLSYYFFNYSSFEAPKTNIVSNFLLNTFNGSVSAYNAKSNGLGEVFQILNKGDFSLIIYERVNENLNFITSLAFETESLVPILLKYREIGGEVPRMMYLLGKGASDYFLYIISLLNHYDLSIIKYSCDNSFRFLFIDKRAIFFNVLNSGAFIMSNVTSSTPSAAFKTIQIREEKCKLKDGMNFTYEVLDCDIRSIGKAQNEIMKTESFQTVISNIANFYANLSTYDFEMKMGERNRTFEVQADINCFEKNKILLEDVPGKKSLKSFFNFSCRNLQGIEINIPSAPYSKNGEEYQNVIKLEMFHLPNKTLVYNINLKVSQCEPNCKICSSDNQCIECKPKLFTFLVPKSQFKCEYYPYIKVWISLIVLTSYLIVYCLSLLKVFPSFLPIQYVIHYQLIFLCTSGSFIPSPREDIFLIDIINENFLSFFCFFPSEIFMPFLILISLYLLFINDIGQYNLSVDLFILCSLWFFVMSICLLIFYFIIVFRNAEEKYAGRMNKIITLCIGPIILFTANFTEFLQFRRNLGYPMTSIIPILSITFLFFCFCTILFWNLSVISKVIIYGRDYRQFDSVLTPIGFKNNVKSLICILLFWIKRLLQFSFELFRILYFVFPGSLGFEYNRGRTFLILISEIIWIYYIIRFKPFESLNCSGESPSFDFCRNKITIGKQYKDNICNLTSIINSVVIIAIACPYFCNWLNHVFFEKYLSLLSPLSLTLLLPWSYIYASIHIFVGWVILKLSELRKKRNPQKIPPQIYFEESESLLEGVDTPS